MNRDKARPKSKVCARHEVHDSYEGYHRFSDYRLSSKVADEEG